MGTFLLSITSAESLSWIGFVVLAIALIGEAGICVIPAKWEKMHRDGAFAFAILAAAGYAVERVGDDAILDALKMRATSAEDTLKKITADRSLTDEQVARMASMLLPFAGQQFTINTYWQDREPTKFSKRIGDNALIAGARWQYVRPTGILVARISGIVVSVSHDADEMTRGAASALISAFKAVDLDASLNEDTQDKAVISMTIGIKP
jgi:hypothetical protein